jgi:signal transduction histidine kinase
LIYSRHVALLQRKSEEERRAMERKMLENQKLESLGVMAGGVAHDFNNLLTTIIGNAGLARMDLPGDSPQQTYLRNVEKTGRHAAGLCQQLMAYTGKTRFQLQRVELGGFLEGMHPLLQASVARNAVLEVELKPDTPAIEADPSQLRQVVMQLVINASEALPEGSGWIRVETKPVLADRTWLEGASVGDDLPPGEYAGLEVSDNGCGMDGETLSRIFDPFFTTKFIGRGLGLAAVSGIVRAHRGALRLRSDPGHGSSFQILFPSVHPMPERPVLNDDLGNGDRASGMKTADKSAGPRE